MVKLEDVMPDGRPRCQVIFRLYANGDSRPAQCECAAKPGEAFCAFHMAKAKWEADRARKGTKT